MSKIVIFTSIVFIVFSSCGTETGNPVKTTELIGDDPSQGQADKYFISRLSDEICSKLVECFSDFTTTSSCRNIIEDLDGFDAALNLNTSYTDLNDIYADEQTGELTVSQTEADQCESDINGLSCSDSEVTSAYSDSSSGDYSNLDNIIPVGSGSCQDALSSN